MIGGIPSMIVINVLWATFVLVPARGSNKSSGHLALRVARCMVHVPDSVLTIKDFAGHVARLLGQRSDSWRPEERLCLKQNFFWFFMRFKWFFKKTLCKYTTYLQYTTYASETRVWECNTILKAGAQRIMPWLLPPRIQIAWITFRSQGLFHFSICSTCTSFMLKCRLR